MTSIRHQAIERARAHIAAEEEKAVRAAITRKLGEWTDAEVIPRLLVSRQPNGATIYFLDREAILRLGAPEVAADGTILTFSRSVEFL